MRHPGIYIVSAVFFLTLVLTSCEKKELAITLPPAGSARPGNVDMGEDYSKMIYYDFEHNTVVKTSELASWDFAFETGSDGRHVFLNGGKDVMVINTHQKSFAAIPSPPPPNASQSDWRFDAPDGNPDKTGIGDWYDQSGGNSNGDVYLVQVGSGKYKKVKFLTVNPQQYVIQYGDLTVTNPKTLVIPKAADYNFSYFSFDDGIVSPEPPKAEWDVVFTYYKELVFFSGAGHAIPYSVCGVLLNPFRTSAAVDSTDGYGNINISTALALPESTARNIIGYDWKTLPTGIAGLYVVNPRKSYVLHTRNEHIIKLHFLDFYHSGVKGSPSFESEVLQ